MPSAKYLLIVSVDALNMQDYNYIQTLPNFKKFFEEGAHCKNVASVYPSVTYTCHTSVSTGHYPKSHGIFNNELPDPSHPSNQPWHWFEEDIKVPTLFDYAKQAGLSTATILWPVTGNADITYNVPEIWSPDESVSKLRLFWRHGSRNVLWPVVRNSRLLKGNTQPYLDNFTETTSLNIIKRYKPNLTAVHFTDLDVMRHLYGLHSSQSKDALNRIDQRIGHLIDLYQSLGLHDQTNYVLFGDHGTHNFNKVIEINSFLRDEGLLRTNKDGIIIDWQAYACSCGGSTQIHTNPDLNAETLQRLKDALNKLLNMTDTPIKALFTNDELRAKHHLGGSFTYVLEAKDDYVFRNTISGNLILDANKALVENYKADHGYLPDHKDLRTLLLMKGPSIQKGATLEGSRLVDEGPTFAALLGLKMEKTDGHILRHLLK